MGFWVYMLKCADDSYYVGHTEDLETRIGKHSRREIPGYTSSRLPVRLLFSQEHPTREEALAAERRIKGWSRKKKEALIRGDWDEVSRLARSRHNNGDIRPSTGSGRTVRGKN
ncbi:MAG: GIY-YIG nuclease family protein [Burkholderiales bacterium]|nr:GIY-YIG nuclease family protein [Burkholderiales bacterium]